MASSAKPRPDGVRIPLMSSSLSSILSTLSPPSIPLASRAAPSAPVAVAASSSIARANFFLHPEKTTVNSRALTVYTRAIRLLFRN